MDKLKWVFWLLSGGWAKNYRTQITGLVTALVAILNALQNWSLGNMSLIDLLNAIGTNWAPIVAGLAIWFGADKFNAILRKPALGEPK